MIYTLTLNPSIDCSLFCTKAELGTINRSLTEEVRAGGKGINVSKMLKVFHVPSKAIAVTAGAAGKYFEELCKKEELDYDFVYMNSGETRTCVKIEDTRETAFNPAGPQISEEKFGELVIKLMDLKYNDVLIISGSPLPNLQPNVYNRIINALNTNTTVIVDTAGKALLHALKAKPWLIKPNFHELEELCGVKIDSDEMLLKSLRVVQKAGAQNILLSMGKKGALLYTVDGEMYVAKTKEEKVISTVGAGDCLLAAFVATYLKYNDYRRALLTGVACGSAKAYSRGIPTLLKVRECMMDTVIETTLKK